MVHQGRKDPSQRQSRLICLNLTHLTLSVVQPLAGHTTNLPVYVEYTGLAEQTLSICSLEYAIRSLARDKPSFA